MPGCQVLVAKNGNVVYDRSLGKLNPSLSSSEVKGTTLYDLASMSKVCGTLAALMKTYDIGLWELDDPLKKYIPELKEKSLGDVTMKQLLYHESGLPPMLSIFSLVVDTATYEGDPIKYRCIEPYTIKIQDGVYGNRNAKLRNDLYSSDKSEKYYLPVAKGIYASDSARIMIMDAIYDIEPKSKKSFVYSDLNFCLLMKVNENITGIPHDQFLEEEILNPLGMWRTGYNPVEFYEISEVAPTEKDNFLRKQHVQGYVHDETAAFSGGVQGSAGLFSNTADLVKLFQTWLNGGKYGDIRLFSEETVKLFTGRKSPTCDRLLGFDMLTTKTDWGVSPRTFGHTGFTGTCVWIDPDKELIYIFLSNRVNPTRSNKAFTRYNPRYSVLKEIYDSMK